MQLQSNTSVEVPIPNSLSAQVLSIAIVGPNGQLRKELISALQHSHEGQIREFSTYPSGLDDVPRLLEQQHDVIMIELDSNPEYALDLVEGVCANRTSTVMLYSNYSDPDLGDPDLLVRCMRAGAREFLSSPFGETAVAEALIRAVARRAASRSQKKTGGRLLVFYGVKGGTGVTSIACNLAVALAETAPDENTLLIDFDLPLGDAALLLGIAPQYTTIDALQNHSRLDSKFFSKLLVKHNSGLHVLAAPGKMVSFTSSPDAIESLVRIARQDFSNVVVDIGSKQDFRSTALCEQASTLYLVTQAGVSELRNANRLITEYFSADETKLEIILNRHQARGNGVTEENIRRALTKAAEWKVPNDYFAVRRMQNTAKPVVSGDSPIAGVIGRMARTVYGLPEPSAKKKGFTLRNLGKSIISDADDSPDITRLGLTGELEPERSSSGSTETEEAVHQESASTDGDERLPVRVYKGNSYVKRSDGQWYLQEKVAEELSEEADEAPLITWPTPEPILYGTPLSAVQYNPSASISGRFYFTPVPGFILPAGSHTLWATFTPDKRADKTPIQSGVSITVNKATPAILWDPPTDIPFGTALSSIQLGAVASIPGSFVYSHSEGDVLPEGQHELSVIFTPEDIDNYTDAAAAVPLVVTKPVPTVTWSMPASAIYGVALSSEQLNAVASVPGSFVYSPPEGTVLPAGEHTLTVKFTPEDGGAYGIAQAAVLLNIIPATPIVTWRTPSTIPFGIGLSEIQFNATASVQGTFEYSPAEGEILTAGRHSLSVVFTPTDYANYTKTSARVDLTVAKSKPAINWPVPAPITYGTPLSARQLNATSPVAGSFHYIPGHGAVLAAGKHMPSVIFTPEDKENYSQSQCTVPLTVTKSVPSIQWQIPARISYGTPLSSEQLCASASVPGTLTYKPGIGAVLPVGEHAIGVTFAPADSTNFTPVQSSVPLIVSEAVPPTIEWAEPESIMYGTSLSELQLSARTTVDGTFDYSPSAGEVLATGRHVLTVSFTPADGNLPVAHAKTTLVVTKAVPVIQWNEPASIVYGTALSDRQLNASTSLAGIFQYKPAAGEVLNAGKQTLTVLFTPSDKANFTEAKSRVTISVEKVPPSITWQSPSPIVYGTALSSSQLNARASVPGALIYVPAEGTVLTAGRHSLSAHFSPADTLNYTSTQTSVVLQVEGLASVSGQEIPEMLACGQDEAVNISEPKFVDPQIIQPEQQRSPLRSPINHPPPSRVAGRSTGMDSEMVSKAHNAEASPEPSPSPESQLETRTYKGNTYVKGADGQWHLQKR